MPTYVYECSSCNSTFEVEQRITESALDTCTCGSTGTVKRLIQPIAVMFKGSGFHINDYSGAATAPAKTEGTETKADAPAACTGEPKSCAACAPVE
jgi:putative FmdB family regulatory protein